MNSRYQEMFDEVRASDTLKQEVLRMQNQENGRRTRRRLPVAGLAAAVLAVVLVAGTALAVASPSLRDWFAREWAERTGGNISENQALLIDSLTQKVGESRTVGDVTVTVDSITVGGDVLWALVDVEGLDFAADQQYTFGKMAVDILPDPSEGNGAVMAYSVGSIGLTESGAVRMLLEYSGTFSTANRLNAGGYTLSLRLEDLARVVPGGGSADDEVIAQGQWDFSIPLTVDYSGAENEVFVLTVTVTDSNGLHYIVNNQQRQKSSGSEQVVLTGTGTDTVVRVIIDNQIVAEYSANFETGDLN